VTVEESNLLYISIVGHNLKKKCDIDFSDYLMTRNNYLDYLQKKVMD